MAAVKKKAVPKKKVFKFPKTMGTCADKLWQIREKKSAAKKVLDAIEEEEKALKEHIINTLPKSNASGVSGKLANVKVYNKQIPQVNDWDKFYAFVKRNNAFELMQRRLSTAAVEERLESKKKIPGVEIFKATTVSLTKV